MNKTSVLDMNLFASDTDMSKYAGKKIIAIDVETTGLSHQKGDELLQLSIANIKGCLFNSYLKPKEKTEWPSAMAVNKISPEKVENAPYPEYVRDYVQKLFDAADYVVGFNVGFDIGFIRACMKINIPDEKVVDVLDIFRKDTPNLPHHKLENAVELYGSDRIKASYANGAHDALVDAEATLDIFIKQYWAHLK